MTSLEKLTLINYIIREFPTEDEFTVIVHKKPKFKLYNQVVTCADSGQICSDHHAFLYDDGKWEIAHEVEWDNYPDDTMWVQESHLKLKERDK